MERSANQRKSILVLAVLWRNENRGCLERPWILRLVLVKSEVDRAFQ
jgi:hypothetical protein